MDLAEARLLLTQAAWYPANPSGAGIDSEPLELQLKKLSKLARAGKMPTQGAAIWYALTQGLRDLADTFEADLFHQLHDRDEHTWAAIAVLVDAKLGSRQAVQRRAQRVADAPARRRRKARSGAVQSPQGAEGTRLS